MAYTQTNRTPEVMEKYREVVRLRTLGFTFDDIASRVGYGSRQGAHDAYTAALKWWGTETVEEARRLEEERLEHLWRSVMGRLQAAQTRATTDTNEIMSVVNTALSMMKRKAALLGLDAPRQLEVTGQDGGAITTDIGEMLRERMGMARAGMLSLDQGEETNEFDG